MAKKKPSAKVPEISGQNPEYKVGPGKPPLEHRFKPGNPGGPGRPLGSSLTARLREMLDKNTLGGKPIPGNKQVAELVVEALIKGALKGNVPCIKEIFDRMDGKVAESATADSGSGDGASRITVVKIVKPDNA